MAVYTVWARPSTLAQKGEEAYLPSGDAFTLPVSEMCIPMPWASLESEGQTTWQEGVVRYITNSDPTRMSGALEGSFRGAGSSFQVLKLLHWAPTQRPFHDSSWVRSQNLVAYWLNAPLSKAIQGSISPFLWDLAIRQDPYSGQEAI